ncbi:MAG: hypothetical protein PHD48_04365 [Alphaproteobacteria bacterium]|nr:hypothetical protein [Alphaproteobacteria bacterium]
MINPRQSFLLLIGDDGAILLPPQNHGCEAALQAPSHHEKDCAALFNRIAKDPSLPVHILADTLTQSYKIEAIPSLSFFDRRKLVARRLDQAFPKAMLKASRVLQKQKALLIALETKGAMDLWLERLATCPNPSGVCLLLPIECSDMMTSLLPESKNGWGLLVMAQKTGGLRQIVTHNGHFVFTRLTPPLSETTGAALQAASLALDIKATRDYLSRFGLTHDTPLHMAAILPLSMHAAMAAIPLDVTSRCLLTPHETAAALRLSSRPLPFEPMADLNALLWVARKRKARLPLMPEHVRLAHTSNMIRAVGMTLALFVMLLTVLLGGFRGYTLFDQKRRIDITRTQVRALEAELQHAQVTLAPAAEPLGRLRRAAERQRLFTQSPCKLFALLMPIAEAINRQARVTRLHWHENILTLDITLFDEKSHKIGQIETPFQTLHEKLRAALPNAKVEKNDTEAPKLTNVVLSNEGEHPAPPAMTRFVITVDKP